MYFHSTTYLLATSKFSNFFFDTSKIKLLFTDVFIEAFLINQYFRKFRIKYKLIKVGGWLAGCLSCLNSSLKKFTIATDPRNIPACSEFVLLPDAVI